MSDISHLQDQQRRLQRPNENEGFFESVSNALRDTVWHANDAITEVVLRANIRRGDSPAEVRDQDGRLQALMCTDITSERRSQNHAGMYRFNDNFDNMHQFVMARA